MAVNDRLVDPTSRSHTFMSIILNPHSLEDQLGIHLDKLDLNFLISNPVFTKKDNS